MKSHCVNQAARIRKEKAWFFICGAQRAGTTSLYRWLEQSRSIHGINNGVPEPKILLKSHDFIDEFLNGVKITGSNNVFLEKATTYIERPRVTKTLARFNNFKLIFLLRDPAKRAVSNYFFSKANGFESRSLEEAVFGALPRYDKRNISVSPYNYLARGFYYQMISPFLRYIGRDRIILINAEKFFLNKQYRADLAVSLGCSDIQHLKPLWINQIDYDDKMEVDEVIHRLHEYYRKKNLVLAEKLAFDITPWGEE